MSLFIQNLAAMQQKVIPGIDSFLQINEAGKKLRYALVTNDAAFTSDGILSRMALIRNGFNLVKIFSPEHGILVKGTDGVFQSHETDIVTGLPIISLYGDRLSPMEKDLKDVDLVLFDIPDVGCRFYTYQWTMTHVMEACALYDKPFIVLDRPNPTGGDISMAEGPMLDETSCSSFIGRWSIPIRHCCTLGELALYFADKIIKVIDIKVIPAKNWKRNQIAGTPGFDFIPTSPAIRDISTALVYPGMGLLEGINVNEGRGTDKPFMKFGAPWVEGEELLEAMIQKGIPGIKIKPCIYTPVDSLYRDEKCSGLELSITEKEKLHPVALGIEFIMTILEQYPLQVKERAYITHVNPTGGSHLDRLLGIKSSFDLLQSGTAPQTDIAHTWATEIAPFLLYD